MPVEPSIVDAQIRALGEIDKFGTKKEISYLPEILTPGEEIHGLCSGFMDGNTWLCVATSKRILMLDKGLLLGLKQIELPLSQIKSVSHKTGLIFGELLIETGGKTKKNGTNYEVGRPQDGVKNFRLAAQKR